MILLDKVAIVTGAAKGIGLAIAESLLAEGAIVYPLDMADLPDGYNPQLAGNYIQGDITDTAFVKQAVLSAKKRAGKIDILVNNAGLVSYEPFSMAAKESVKKMFEVNVLANIELTQYVSRVMKRQGGGSIINMASIVGLRGQSGQAVYAASKGALISLTYSLAKELAKDNIRVNALAPGMVGTERLKREMAGRFDGRVDDIGLNRMAEPREIADVCVFLASDKSTYLTGQVIGLDGCLKI